MKRALELFASRFAPPGDSPRGAFALSSLTGAADAAVAVVTSDFHMGRALNLARQEGLTNASGLPAKTPRISWIGCAFREALILGAQKLGFRPSNITIGSKRL